MTATDGLVSSIRATDKSLPAQFLALRPYTGDLQEKVRTLSAQSANPPEALVDHLSYSHFELLIGLEDDLKRSFYQTEAIRGQWSVRELRRQIGSLLFERTGLSIDKARLAEVVRQGAETNIPALAIRDPSPDPDLLRLPQATVLDGHLTEKVSGTSTRSHFSFFSAT